MSGRSDSFSPLSPAAHDEHGHRPDLEFASEPDRPARADERILEEVSASLAADVALDASRIEVSVVDGDVRLTGFVDTAAQKREARNRARRPFGVRRVRNDLRIMVPGEPIATETGQ